MIEALAHTVPALAAMRWNWSLQDLERLVVAAGRTYRAPSEGNVSCDFGAGAGAFLFGDEVTAVWLSLVARPTPAPVLARRDAFAAAVDVVTGLLGPPATPHPGPDPSAGWPVASGVLEVVDKPGALDLWLRPGPRRTAYPRNVVDLESAPTWADLEAGLADAAASLPAGTVVWLTDDLVLSQAADRLTVTIGGTTRVLAWPARGADYAELATDLVIWLRDEAGHRSPEELSYRSDLPIWHLPLRRA
ncbi:MULTISPECIES: DUF6301 family protein [Actinoplanes]|uniref:DUF6301 family protein n=1 Tax=Actinoplanes TaxID=1865 RepID=UPI0012F90015|nr:MULTISPECIES: DUF6301 family protein [Actinoplanes]GLY01682.1 hypothetical protein Acsp01_20610 [Actinoplanes sp. NBRC 101535]